MKIAATYSRVSLPDQADNFSLSSQTRAMHKLAAEQSYRIPKEFEFVDDGYLGGEMDRPAFCRMREAIRAGRVNAVICYDPDRLVRGLALQMILEEECEKYGVTIMYVTMPADTSAEGKMLRQMRGVFSEYEKHKIRERTLRGRREKAEQGFANGGRAAYGYAYHGREHGKKGEYVIIPEQAEVVRRIFGMAEAGSTLLEIARALNASGVPPLMASQWTKPVIAGILRNRVYIGEGCYNRRMSTEPKSRRKSAQPGKSKKTSQRLRASSEWITFSVPAIIEREQFERVRAQIERTAALNVGRPAKQYLLRGLLKCGICGRSVCVQPNKGRPRYRCNNLDRLTYRRNCDAPSVAVDRLEAAVWSRVVEACSQPEAFEAMIREHERRTARSASASARDRERIEGEIFKLKQREMRAANAMLDDDVADSASTFRQALKAAQSKRRDLERKLAALAPAQKNSGINAHQLARWFRETMKKPEGRREVLTRLVTEVRLSADELDIEFALPAYIFRDPGDWDTNRFNRQHDENDMLLFTVKRKIA